MARGASAIAACVNLQSLTVRTSSDQQPFSLFNELLDFQLRLPALRHVFLSFTLGHHTLAFVERHSAQLESISIYMAGDLVDGQLFCSNALCDSFSIPLSISTIHCSPLLTPIFVPLSQITGVSLYWPCRQSDLDELPHIAQDVLIPLTQSSRPIVVLVYTSLVWHIEFIALAAVQLRELQYLRVDNNDKKGRDLMDTRNVRIMHLLFILRIVVITDSFQSLLQRDMLSGLSNILPSFRTLKVLLLYGCIWDRLPGPN